MSNNQERGVFKAREVEADEIGVFVEEFTCFLCDGSGEFNSEDADGMEYTEECSDCDGAGVLYVSID